MSRSFKRRGSVWDVKRKRRRGDFSEEFIDADDKRKRDQDRRNRRRSSDNIEEEE